MESLYTVRTARKKQLFLKHLAEHATVVHSCNLSNISRSNVYKWREEDPEFAEAWDRAMDTCAERMEQCLYDKGIGGDNTAMIFWLKGNVQKYRGCDRAPNDPAQANQTTVNVTVDFQSLVKDLNDSELGLLRTLATRRANPQPQAGGADSGSGAGAS